MSGNWNGKYARVHHSKPSHTENIALGFDDLAHGTTPARMIQAKTEVANPLVEDLVSRIRQYSSTTFWYNFIFDE
jgi:hypothetical protein